jgi:hypothetical protein
MLLTVRLKIQIMKHTTYQGMPFAQIPAAGPRSKDHCLDSCGHNPGHFLGVMGIEIGWPGGSNPDH